MKTHDELYDMAQQYALSLVLSDWDENFTYGEVLEILEQDTFLQDPNISVWEPYACWDGQSVANLIDEITASTMILLGRATQ